MMSRLVVMQRVAQVLKAAQVHALTNQLLRTGVAQLHEAIAAQQNNEPVKLLWVSGAMFVNGGLVNQGPGVAHTIETIKKLFERLKVHEVSFDATATEADLFAFLEVFQRHWQSPTPEAVAHEVGVIRFRALGKKEVDALAAGTIDHRQNLLRSYARLAMLTKVVVDHAKERQPFKVSTLRRAIQQLADASSGTEALLSGLTRFPNLQGDLHFHLVTTAALTLLMGRKLELGKVALVDLVQAALLHDLARFDFTELGADVAARSLLSAELPARSMLNVAALGHNREGLVAAANAFEVSLSVDAPNPLLRPGATARLVAVPAYFSRLTSPQPPRKAFAPDQALMMIRRRAGTVFDEDVVKLFISTVGLYPVGSTVRLSSGELAVVLQGPSNPADGARPVVKIVQGPSGAMDAVVDLSTDPARRMVLEALAPVESVNPMPLLLA